MRKVKIITDSVCDILTFDEKEGKSLFDIDFVPLYVRFKEEVYKDYIDIRPRELYKKVEEYGYLPSTSSPSPFDYEHMFRKYIDEGYDIVFFSIGSDLSSAFKTALLASEEFEKDRIYVFDSKNLSSGIGIQIIKACKLRDQGKSAKEIYDYFELNKHKSVCKFVIDTMEYLHKGGRCGAIIALLGTVIKLKPLIAVTDGKMKIHQRPIGTRRALNVLINNFEDDFKANNVDEDCILITHSETPSHVEFIKEKLIALGVNKNNIHISEANCTVATHCGPNCIGIIYLTK